jgi:hypothetical protein
MRRTPADPQADREGNADRRRHDYAPPSIPTPQSGPASNGSPAPPAGVTGSKPGPGYLLRSGSHLATLGCAFALTACQFPLSSLIPLFHRRFQPHLHQIRSKGPSAIRLATLCSSVRNAECCRNTCSDRRLPRPYNLHTSACGLDILLRSDFHPLVFRAVRARIGFVFEVDSAPGGRGWPRLALRTGDPITSINRRMREVGWWQR